MEDGVGGKESANGQDCVCRATCWSGDTVRMDDEETAMVCATCGGTPDDPAAARLTWARGVENGRTVWTCERCSREHLRSIEGKLDSAWW